jgi:hypothetical protein
MGFPPSLRASVAAAFLFASGVAGHGAASLLEVRDANGNPLTAGFLTQEDTAFTLSLRTTQAGLDSASISATARAGGDAETWILKDTTVFRDHTTFSLRVGFAIAVAAADGKSQASAFDTLVFRWVNPSDTAEVAEKRVPVRPARRAARAWFSSRADGGDTVTQYAGTESNLHLAVLDQVQPSGLPLKATLRTLPAISSTAADTETVDLVPVSGKPGLLAVSLAVQSGGAAVSGDGKLRLGGGDQMTAYYLDPMDRDTAAAYAGFGVPASNVLGDLQFTDAGGQVIPKGAYYSPVAGKVYLRLVDDWASGRISSKPARLVVSSHQGNAPSDTETVILNLVPAMRSGATAYWLGEIPLRDHGPLQVGDNVATQPFIARLVASVTAHKADSTAEGEVTDTLLSSMPQEMPKVRMEDSRNPSIAISFASPSIVVKVAGGGHTTAVDTVTVRLRCSQSGDTLVLRLAEDAALSGNFSSPPVPLRKGDARVDDTLTCREKDLLGATAHSAWASHDTSVVLDGSIAVRPFASAGSLAFTRRGDLLRSDFLALHPPRSIRVFDARGVRLGRASAQEAPGTWRLPGSHGPLLLEILWSDGSRLRLSAPPER